MEKNFPLAVFSARFPNDNICLEEIRRWRFPQGIYCNHCRKITRHYKLSGRPVYTCKFCRSQISPLVNTIFEKTTTPLRLWFYALFLMTHTRAGISVKLLQRELNVTYKTAWKMYNNILRLMQQNNGDLLSDAQVRKWIFFNKIELKVVEKKQESLTQ
jgi:transposase-like protein